MYVYVCVSALKTSDVYKLTSEFSIISGCKVTIKTFIVLLHTKKHLDN